MRRIDEAVAGDCFLYDGAEFHHTTTAPVELVKLFVENVELRTKVRKMELVIKTAISIIEPIEADLKRQAEIAEGFDPVFRML